MLFRYWVEFDDNGDIKGLYKSNKDCSNCKEFLIKLIPVERSGVENTKDNNELLQELVDGTKRFAREIDKLNKTLTRLKVR